MPMSPQLVQSEGAPGLLQGMLGQKPPTGVNQEAQSPGSCSSHLGSTKGIRLRKKVTIWKAEQTRGKKLGPR